MKKLESSFKNMAIVLTAVAVVAGLLGWTLLSLTLPQYKKPAS